MTHYALINDQGLFIAKQDSTVWLEEDCIGWVICSNDLDWVQSQSENFDGSTVVKVARNHKGNFILKESD